MTRSTAVARRVEDLLGAAVVSAAPVAGGDISTATRIRLSDGRMVVIKTRPQAPAGLFAAEARSLRWLGETDTVAVPHVLAVEADCLILDWVETTRPTTEAAARFGRELAELHRSGADQFGAAHDGFIGLLPLPNQATNPATNPAANPAQAEQTWAEFFAARRIWPYLKLAVDRGAVAAEDAAAIEQVARRLPELAGPDEPPARLHGDLWSGNVLWGSGGRCWVVDPASYGGHRETDLAMLALFGVPHLDTILAAYREAFPLAEEWERRVPLHQLFPLLVHACLFGGGYGARAGAAARSLL